MSHFQNGLLPLRSLFRVIPDHHWLLSRRHLIPASSLFYFDVARRQLKIKKPYQFTVFPRLLSALSKSLIQSTTFKLHPFLRSYFFDEPLATEQSTKGPISSFLNSVRWTQFNLSVIRSLGIDCFKYFSEPISWRLWVYFWKLPMLLPARSVWYRVLSKKIPHGEYLYRIKAHRDSPLCLLCRCTLEDLPHFLVFCRDKLYLWQTTLSTFFPWLFFPPKYIYSTLLSLSVPDCVPTESRSNYLLLVSTIQFAIWKFYWSFSIHQIPFDRATILSYIFTQFRLLTHPLHVE